jgi:hypothetical protein
MPMNRNFTLDDLILLAYNETGDEQIDGIVEALNLNEEFLDEYLSIATIQQELDKIREEPSESTINNILNYSKAVNVFKLLPAVNTGIFIVN